MARPDRCLRSAPFAFPTELAGREEGELLIRERALGNRPLGPMQLRRIDMNLTRRGEEEAPPEQPVERAHRSG